MNYGVRCGTSAADGVPDIVTHGQSGLFSTTASRPNTAEHSRALESLLGAPDRLRHMPACARAQVRADLDGETIATRIAVQIARL
jgi:glycosyltransferase involved in cell wall biosynthesis